MIDLGTGGILAVCAFRYCCGRRTYVVGEFVRWAMRNWPHIDKKARHIIQRELRDEIERDDEIRGSKTVDGWMPLGDNCDRKEWLTLMEFIQEQEQSND